MNLLHLWAWELSEGLTPFEHCSQRGFFRPRVAFQRKWVFVGHEECLLYLESFLLQFRLTRMGLLRESWSFRWEFGWRFVFHLWAWELSEGLTPFEHCSQRGFFRPRVAFQRKWVFVGHEECLLYLESFLLQFRLTRMGPLRGSLFFLLGSLQISAYFLSFLLCIPMFADFIYIIFLIITIHDYMLIGITQLSYYRFLIIIFNRMQLSNGDELHQIFFICFTIYY